MSTVLRKGSSLQRSSGSSFGARLLPGACLLALASLIGQAGLAARPEGRLKFDRLSLDEGLSQITINAMLQDRLGFLWLGTQDGLNRFDGYEVTIFRHDPANPASMADNFVVVLYEDREGSIWIVSQQSGVLTRFDPRTEQFHRFLHDPDDATTLLPSTISPAAICEDDGRALWLGTLGGGINLLDKATGSVRRLVSTSADEQSLSSNNISRIFRDRSGTLWSGTFDAGLNELLAEGGTGGEPRFRRYLHDPNDPGSLGHNAVSAIYEDSHGALWIGTLGGGLSRLDSRTGTFERFQPRPDDQRSLPGSFIPPAPNAILEDRLGQLWVLTNAGLARFDAATASFDRFRTDAEGARRLSSNAVSDLLEDSAGTLWVATQGGGVNRYDPERDGFSVVLHDARDPRSLSSNFVQVMMEDRSGIVWFGTNGGGASRFSRGKHIFHQFSGLPGDPGALSDQKVFSLLEDSSGTLWVGTMEGGLQRLDADRRGVLERYGNLPGTDRDLGSDFVRALHEDERGNLWVGTTGGGLALVDRTAGRVVARYVADPDDPESLSNNFVSSVLEDSRGELWIGTNNGWALMDRDRGKFRVYRNDPQDPASLVHDSARFTFEDRHGDLWVGTAGGLSRFDRQSETFTNYAHALNEPQSLSNNNVMDLAEDREGDLWVATYGGGVNRLDRQSGRFFHLTTQDGLPNDSIYSLILDEDGFFWLTTNQGVAKLDPVTFACTNYDAEDGLGGNEFNGRSFSRGATGEIFIGGMHGFNSFFPREIIASDYKPPVLITAFRKFGERQRFDLALDRLERIELSYRDNFISFEFAALDFAKPQKTRYAYMLEGFDREWIQSGNRRYASYTNLDGGTYTFRVKGSNGDGVWNEEGASLELVVIPPPWKTWWAYTLYVLLASAGVLGYASYKSAAHQRELRTHREEIARQRLLAERLRQIDRMKDEFLANTSHELRTPLNGIIGIAESLLDGATGELTPETRSNLFMVASSGRRLAHLVDDILDFSKLKNRQIELKRAAVGMREIVDVVMTLSRPLVAAKGVSLENRIDEELPAVDGDENRLLQVMHNLVGNAIKFTETGSIVVSAMERDGRLDVRVTDTGIGIPADKLDTIFESFEQVDSSSTRRFGGTGLGLTISRQLVELHGGSIRVESEKGSGSEFTVSLPIWKGERGPARAPEAAPLARVIDHDRVGAAPAQVKPAPLPPAAPAAAARRETAPGKAGLARVRILMVDDEPINLQVLHNILSQEEFELMQATDGEQALRILREDRVPDLILLDVMMPRLTGFEVAQQIRTRFSANELPIILLTAKNQVSDLVEGLASGANDYLTKPFSKSELLARIRTHLSLSRAHTVEAENRRKTEELEQARAIQLSLLPHAPPELPHLEIAVFMKTATEVGGDYYDFFLQEDGSLYATTGDATGHGISAGMMVSMTKSALKALDVQSPHVLLAQLNRVIRAVNPERMKMALNVAHIRDGEIAISSAGMPPALLYRGARGEVDELLISGLPLGSLEDSQYRLEVTELALGDALVLISDGLPELLNSEGTFLGYGAVRECLAAHGTRSAEGIVQALVSLGEEWAGEAGHDDDITVVVIRRI